jgi:hypothetical protein
MMRRLVVTGLLALGGLLAFESSASAQEIQLTGPLAGAPAVRGMRWHRKGRFEIAPSVSFSLLDEFQRTMLVGARLNYNLTDWLALGVWGAYGLSYMKTGLTNEIEKVNKDRWSPASWPQNDSEAANKKALDRNASVLSVGKDFPSQVAQITWVVAPQLTAVPFRGKLAIFQKVFVDTDLYFFAGPAFVGLKERADFSADRLKTEPCLAPLDTQVCVHQPKYDMATRTTFTGTFGMGLSFYTGKFTGLSLEYRALPFSWNTSGFDSRGGPPDEGGPDFKVNDKDRSFHFNQFFAINFSIFLPTDIKSSP